ncbi:hypothetical protein ACJIZ3_003766 [Penstemon smallii]|uniref:Growth-regulating factor n=1 Tax=Penstemon smallii TaxID=265156 RepID=A0ABD3S089_9LAMI
MLRNGNERKSPSSSVDCDVGLGLKMQVQPSTEETETLYSSSTCKRATTVPLYHPHYQLQQFVSSENVTGFSVDGACGGGSFLNQVAAGGGDDIYESLHTSNGSGFFRPSGGGVCGKSPFFTASQWEELERQKMIHKYMMASIPVPPQLLLPISRTTLAPIMSQSNKSSTGGGGGQDLRFTSSSSSSTSNDPEPWRCKRTDGKKWRCSRDVATPEQKYCERHAHKTRTSRSRKPVEIIPSHHHNNNLYNTPQQPLQIQSTMDNQNRCIEWFIRGGGSNEQQQQQWQQHQVMMNKDQNKNNTNNNNNNNNVSYLYQQPPHEYAEEEEGKQSFMSLINPYNTTINHQRSSNSILDPTQKTTRHFIDAWGEDKDESRKKFSPSSSLTLSMSAGTTMNWNIDDDQDNNNNNNNEEKENDDDDDDDDGMMMMKPVQHQWMNMNPAVSWMMNSTTPGGPLGEALCLGNNNTTTRDTCGSLNLTSPPRVHGHGYSNNNNINNSKRSSCGEDGSLSHALNFIG